jgi:alpha-beta hydrolase superfamily lysophospholipase
MKSPYKNLTLNACLILAIGFFTFMGATSLRAQSTAATAIDSTSQRPWYDLGMMADPILDQSLLFYMAMTWSGQADVGECLETASRVNVSDPDSWAVEWTKTAGKLISVAEVAEKQNHKVSAGQAYLRAATYYSAALHRHNDPKAQIVKDNTLAASKYFRKAVKLLGIHAEPVQIPYGNITLPGYFFRSPMAKGPAPVLIVHQGRDGWAMHCKYIADAAISRGYHCLLIDGPGQGEALRLQGLPFRPDWENVITPVVDYLVARKDIDTNRIGLMGLSMGGALAPRAVAYEKRIKVCVANPGVLSWPDIISGFLEQIDPQLTYLWRTDPDGFNKLIAAISAQVPLVDWGIRDMMWKHGAATPAELMVKMQAYSNKDIVSKISCRMLVMDGAADEYSQGKDLFEALACPKEYMFFEAGDPALQHCQVGAQASSSARLFDWLDENL